MPEHTPAPTPARSIYGFFMYLLSKTALAVFVLWAFLPDAWLNYFNIYYYPQKYWAVAIPIQCLVALTLFVFFIYPGLNLMLTPGIDSVNTIRDSYSKKNAEVNKFRDDVIETPLTCVCKDKSKCAKDKFDVRPSNVSESSIPHAYDIDIRDVCRKLYKKTQIADEMYNVEWTGDMNKTVLK